MGLAYSAIFPSSSLAGLYGNRITKKERASLRSAEGSSLSASEEGAKGMGPAFRSCSFSVLSKEAEHAPQASR